MKTVNWKKKLNLRSLTLIGILVLSVLAVSCNKEEEMPYEEPQIEAGLDIAATLEKISEDPDFLETIYEGDLGGDEELKSAWYRNRPTFRSLIYALIKTDLFWTVVREELTIFAPTDAAFKQFLGDTPLRKVPKETLKNIILYHAVDGKVKSRDLENRFYPTLNGAAVKVDLSSGVMINDAKVKYANLRALNGIIHIIDKVLVPPSKNIVEIASMNGNFTILLTAIGIADEQSDAGIAAALLGDGDFTVFAPTDKAFGDLLDSLNLADVPALIAAVGGPDGLEKVLKYHVVAGARVYSTDLSTNKADVVMPLDGGTFEIDVRLPGIIDNSPLTTIPFAPLNTDLLNIQATNGVIHVIDHVIVPVLP